MLDDLIVNILISLPISFIIESLQDNKKIKNRRNFVIKNNLLSLKWN